MMCQICEKDKSTSDFYSRQGKKCKVCLNAIRRERNKDPERKAKKKLMDAEYYVKNSERIKTNVKKYQENYEYTRSVQSKINRNKYLKRYLSSPQKRIAHNLRNRLNQAIKRGSKAGSAVRDLGCTIEEFKKYIESKWQPGMSWENWGVNGWHIDHIIALSNFDLTDKEQFKQACHFTNQQPLWADENVRKSNKLLD